MILEPVALIHTGNHLIDEQHIELVQLLNMLMLSVESSDHHKIQQALKGLTHYVVEHFTDEEALHREYGMPDFDEHQAAHHKVIANLEKFVQSYNRNPNADAQNMQLLYPVVREFLLQLEHHDVPLAAYVRSHQR